MSKRRPSGDGLIRKRKDGRWEGRIIVGHKQDRKPIFRSVFAKKQSDLMPRLHQLKDCYADVELTEESNMTIGEWLDKWLIEYKKPMLRESTYARYGSAIEHHVKPYIGNKSITQLKTSDLQKLYNKLKASGRKIPSKEHGTTLSNAMVRGVHTLLYEALESAVREGLIPSNPTNGTTPPKIVRKGKTVLTASEMERFMELLKDDEIWHDFFYTDLMTGMRRGEICGLKWSDFDEEKGTLKVARSVRYANREPIIGETKTEDGKRTIFLPDSLWKVLSERKKNAIGKWIFPHPTYPDNPMNPSTAYTRLKELLAKANLPNIRFHDLRHTFASHAANSGIEPKTLAQIVGHTKASFTLDTYAHVTTDMQRNAASIVENYLTDIFGEELKPWQNEEETEQVL